LRSQSLAEKGMAHTWVPQVTRQIAGLGRLAEGAEEKLPPSLK
jgi:hypothetical protein